MLLQKHGAQYINTEAELNKRPLKSFVLMFFSLFSIFIIVGSAGLSNALAYKQLMDHKNPVTNTAFADDDDKAEEKFNDAANNFGSDGDEKGFEKTTDKIEKEQEEKPIDLHGHNFQAIFARAFNPGYINETPKAKPPDGYKNPHWNCDTYRNRAILNTPLYHNCDVPNMITEFLQDLIQTVSPMGYDGAVVTSAVAGDGIGIPSNIPKNEVPIKVQDSPYKYTGLELLGYSMHYTNYNGEWDRIKVMNKARMLSNYGLMDTIKLGVNAAFSAIAAGVSQAASDSLEALSNGDILGAIGNLFTGFFKGSTSEVIQIVLDSSDLNVFNMYAWYRTNYGGTLYNARELNQEERKQFLITKYINMLQGLDKPDKGKLPKDYAAMKAGPPRPGNGKDGSSSTPEKDNTPPPKGEQSGIKITKDKNNQYIVEGTYDGKDIKKATESVLDYGNGKLPESKMCHYPGNAGFFFRCDAAAALSEMNKAFKAKFGHNIQIVPGRWATYRNIAGQQAMMNQYGPARAAKVGYSNHGWGLAMDLTGPEGTNNNSPEHKWLEQNGMTYGWFWPTYLRPGSPGNNTKESWHWQFQGIQSEHLGDTGGTHRDKEGNLTNGKNTPDASAYQSLKDWKTQNKKYFDLADKYKFGCKVNENDEKNRQQQIDAFYTCWDKAWNDHQKDAIAQSQSESNKKFRKDALSEDEIKKFFEKKENNINAPWNIYVCTDKNGLDINGTNGLPKMLYNVDGKLNAGCSKPRPPIQNGYFGNGYVPSADASKQTVLNDTRRDVYGGMGLLNFVINPSGIATNIGNSLLSVDLFATKVANTVLDYSFSPIIKSLGLDKTFITFIESFRDGVYFPLLMLVLAFSAVTVLINAGRNKDYNSGLKSALMMILTVFVSVLALFSPQLLLKVVDEGPAKFETAIAGAIFSINEDDANKLCTATGTTNAAMDKDTGFDNTGLDGGAIVSPSSGLRTMECEVWRVFAFEPYVAGQWGTTSANLYANGQNITNGSTLKNTNGDLVGTADVPMGAGQVEHNWAVYQARLLASGTATNEDTSVAANITPNNMYRIVDAQAGPDNGKGTDPTYLNMWAGKNPMTRVLYSFVGMIVSIIGAVTIIMFGFVKIELTIVSMLLLLFLPVALLFGIHPTAGRLQLKKYLGTILSLMIQRVMLVAVLAIMIKIVTAVATSSRNFLLMELLTAGLCFAFILKKKEIMRLLKFDVDKKMGGGLIGNSTPREALMRQMPRSLQVSIAQRQERTRAMMYGGAAGYIANGRKGIYSGAKEGAARGGNRQLNRERRHGFGVLNNIDLARKQGEEVGKKSTKADRDRLDKDPATTRDWSIINDKAKDIIKDHNDRKENPEKLKDHVSRKWKEPEKTVNGVKETTSFNFNANDDQDYKDMVRLENLKNEIEENKALQKQGPKSLRGMKKLPDVRDEKAYNKVQETIKKHNQKHNAIDRDLNEKLDKTYKEIAQRKVNEENVLRTSEAKRKHLDEMRNNLRDAAYLAVAGREFDAENRDSDHNDIPDDEQGPEVYEEGENV